MKPRTFFRFPVLGLLLLPACLFGQEPPQQPQLVSVCDILKDPKVFSGKKIQIRGAVSSEFEDFTVYDPSCPDLKWSGIWLMFGGDVDCPTPSTWNDVGRPKGQDIKFDGVAYSLVKDQNFRKFHEYITTRKHKKAVYKVIATLEGTFFAGYLGKDGLPGYGHLGCCHLFIIHQVSQVSAERNPKA